MKTTSRDPDRWCSHAPAGQEAWQIVSQWVSPLRLELGHLLEPTPMRTTQFAPPVTETPVKQAPVQGYGKQIARLALESGPVLGAGLRPRAGWGALLSGGQDVAPPPLSATKLMAVCACSCFARICDCRGCPKRWQCQWHGEATTRATSNQCPAASTPGWFRPAAATRDWSRREHRRACMQIVRHQRIEVSLPSVATALPRPAEEPLSRAQRAHARLSWAERLARNARPPTAGQVTIKLFGIPERFATSLGLATA
jgi:hypothetical protein